MAGQGLLFRACRLIGRAAGWSRGADPSLFEGGAVYLCRHMGASGPFRALLSAPIPVKPWILGEFFDPARCRRFFAEVTFRGRFRMPVPLASALAFLIARPFSRLVRSSGGIPVYRASASSAKTFRLSLDALVGGESLLIFPDVDYAGKGDGIGKLHRGFLALDRPYYARTGERARFVPLHVGDKGVAVGKAVSFSGDYKDQWEEVLDRLGAEFRRLESEG